MAEIGIITSDAAGCVMRRVDINNIDEGMVLARDVETAQGTTLLVKGLHLKKRYGYGLRQYKVDHIYVVDATATNSIYYADTYMVSPETKKEAMDLARIIMQGARVGRFVRDAYVSAVVYKLVDELLANDQILISLSRLGTADDYLVEHSVNVAIVSLAVGIRRGYPADKLRVLGKSAFLHDIGKVRVPTAILEKPAPLTVDEFNIVKKHPQWGFALLREAQVFGMHPALVSLQHHEKVNGRGYPLELQGQQINEMAKIVAIADVYDALSTDRCYRRAFLPDRTIAVMRQEAGSHFDRRLFDIFATSVVPYPVGTCVQLNDGRLGHVLQLTAQLSRPVVNVVTEVESMVKTEMVNLLYKPNLSIISSISE